MDEQSPRRRRRTEIHTETQQIEENDKPLLQVNRGQGGCDQKQAPAFISKKNPSYSKRKSKCPPMLIAIIIIEGLFIALLMCVVFLYAQNGWIPQESSARSLFSTPTPAPTATAIPTPIKEYIFITPEPTEIPTPAPIITPMVEYVYITPEPTEIPTPTPIITPVVEYVYITPEPTNTPTPTPIIQYVYVTPSPTPSSTPLPEHVAICDCFDIKQSNPFFFGINWFKQKISDIERELTGKGYVASDANTLGKSFGIAIYQNSMKHPKDITILFDTSSQYPNSISLSFSPDSDLYNDIYLGLNSTWNEGVFHAASKQKQGAYTIETGEYLTWSGNGYQYKLNGEGDNNNVSRTLDQIKNGKSAFVLTVATDNSESVLEKAEELISMVMPESTSTPKPTNIKLDLAISSAKISKNSIGNPEIHVVFKNTSSNETIDRIDFAIRCFDAYNNEIKPYGIYDWTENYYDDAAIRPGKSTSSDWYWTIYGCNGAKYVKIAITKYHTTSGKTVEVPLNSLKWHTFN